MLVLLHDVIYYVQLFVSNPSQFSLSDSESGRNVRQVCDGLATS